MPPGGQPTREDRPAASQHEHRLTGDPLPPLSQLSLLVEGTTMGARVEIELTTAVATLFGLPRDHLRT